jgi:hypothetical protein
MYFLAACLIVVVVSAAVSLRRSRNLSQKLFQWSTPAQRLAARRRALWPTICALFCLLVLLGFYHFQTHEQELGLTVTTDLMMLFASFLAGSMLGFIGGWIE